MKNLLIKNGWRIVVILMVFSIGSCNNEEFFEREAPPETPWLNVNEFERAVIGAYADFVPGTWGGGVIGGHRFVKTIGEDATYWIPGEGGDVPTDALYYRNTDTQISYLSFNTTWTVITNANVALDFLKKNDGNPFPDASDEDLQVNLPRQKGELLFLRGATYWQMAVTFLPWYKPEGGNDARIMPLRTSFPSGQEASSSKIGTVEEIWQQVVSDLTEAKSLLPEDHIAGIHHPTYLHGRANKFVAAFLLARVHFQMGNHAEALKEINYLIDQNGGRFDMSEEPIEAFNRSDETTGRETVWSYPYFDPTETSQWLLFSSFNKSHFNAVNGGGPGTTTGATGFDKKGSFSPWAGFTMSHSIMQQVGWMDENLDETDEARSDKRYNQLFYRLEPYRDPATLTDAENAMGKYEFRYPGVTVPLVWPNKYYRGADGRNTNIPVFRLAEMYLTRAIILFRQGDIPGATDDVNVIRVRAGLAPLTTITEQDIHNERIKEMSQEGDRLDYVRALKLPILPGDRDPSLPTSTIDYPYANYYFAIPQAEYDLNGGYE